MPYVLFCSDYQVDFRTHFCIIGGMFYVYKYEVKPTAVWVGSKEIEFCERDVGKGLSRIC